MRLRPNQDKCSSVKLFLYQRSSLQKHAMVFARIRSADKQDEPMSCQPDTLFQGDHFCMIEARGECIGHPIRDDSDLLSRQPEEVHEFLSRKLRNSDHFPSPPDGSLCFKG